MGGGIRPAAVTLRSLVRKLKVAHAFGCKTARIRKKQRAQLLFTVTGSAYELYYRVTQGILYRVLHLHSDAFTLK